MSTHDSPVFHVSDTARWVAIYRAMESERLDALFHDRWARRLAGPEGQAIVNALPKGRQSAWPMIVRTQVMDELLLRTIAEEKVDTVLNLASGLDTRPYRLLLPPSLRWIEVDFADVLAYKQTVLSGEKPNCQVEFTATDLGDPKARNELFERVGSSSSRTFVIAEGLLTYLQTEHVSRLASDLSVQPSFRWWMIDLASPELLKRLNKTWGKALQRAPLIFGPAEGTKFFAPHGWIEKEYRSIFEEAFRLKRTTPMTHFYRLVLRLSPKKQRDQFKRFSGIVLFERAPV